MTTDELLQLFTGEKAYRQLAAEIRPGRSVGLASLAGSSLSLVAAAAVRQTGGLHVFVMEDRDAAGYLYNDLFPLLGEERLLFSQPATNVRSNSDRKIRRGSYSERQR